MRHLVAVGLATLAVAGVAAAPAAAATGKVVVFTTEVEPLTTFENPSGCLALPATAHQLNNHTDAPVQLYSDPMCLAPALVVKPEMGTHVPPGAASFSPVEG